MLPNDYPGQDCALASALEIVGERWTLLIVRDAFYGARRFGEFLGHLQISRAVLASRLRSLTAAGVLRPAPDPRRPGTDLYELTATGEALWPALHALLRWGEQAHGRTTGRAFLHAACGSLLAAGGACPSCRADVPAREVLTVPPAGTVRAGREDPVSAALRRPRLLCTPLDGPAEPGAGQPPGVTAVEGPPRGQEPRTAAR